MRNSGRSSSAVEIGFSIVGISRISLAIWFAVSLITSMSGPATMSCRSRWPLSLRNQNRMSGWVGEHRADPSLQVLLGRGALRFVDEINDKRRLARLGGGAEDLTAKNQGRAHLRHGAQFLRDRARDAVGVVEPRARRQFDRQQGAAIVVGGNESGGRSCVDHSDAAKITAPATRVSQRWRKEARTSRV